MSKERPINVHQYYPNGFAAGPSWGLGYWDELSGRYQAQLGAGDQKATGCETEYSKNPIGRFSRRSAAVKAAKKRFGYVRCDDE